MSSIARKEEYDWIDDAFDDSKQDPLALKGMTGCSGLAVLGAGLVAVAVIVVIGLATLAFSGFGI